MDPELESNSSRSDGHEDDQPPPKRVKRGPVRRKPACQTCRRRKVRCDNGQPACGFCCANETECVYVTRGDDGCKQDLKQVLKKLDTLSQTVEQMQNMLGSRDTSQPSRSPELETQDRRGSAPIRSAELQKDYLRIPAGRCSSDTVLSWPIFRGQFRESSLITTLFHYSHGASEDRPTDSLTLPDGLQYTPDEQIPALVDRFIQNVHTKNPILDLESLIRSGRHAAEFGLQWDAQSCLVLLACALGCISQPFDTSIQLPQTARSLHDGISWQAPGFNSSSDTKLREGEAFFMMACRRIGLLRYSVIGAQCHFFAGVYLMYTFRPLSAWNHFYQASTFYRLRLRLIDGLDKSAYESEQPGASVAQRLEQSLYWSCFKSEVEIRVELPLPQSAIAEYEYPALFPTPPTLSEEYLRRRDQASDWINDNATQSPEDDQSSLPGRGVYSHVSKLFNEEQSWYYYLTEVALRRMGNRVLNAFYREAPSTWSNIKPLIPIALEFESQINAWFANLPPAMQSYENDPIMGNAGQRYTTDLQGSISRELSWALSNRFLEIRLWLYQPFLYYAAHHPMSTASTAPDNSTPPLASDELGIIQGLVESGLDCCDKILQARSLRHRHHGIWFDLRALVTASLIFIALARSGNVIIPSIHPGGLQSHLRRTLEALIYWEGEAPDIKKARVTLDNLLRELN
ncbi:uncharacterized protein N7511_002286 [Penicillium nucicola]|uniref:uncharacterized protein n=1 Tax=Penicillium nucicola TaxID=1850975 RepID=UPI002545BD62|nr:uncharacterized protein N7511_002286 [Penicillium nucicola]KAJ5770235.1 hypothetical protein N7511_002286 [Penicillium nucicola]